MVTVASSAAGSSVAASAGCSGFAISCAAAASSIAPRRLRAAPLPPTPLCRRPAHRRRSPSRSGPGAGRRCALRWRCAGPSLRWVVEVPTMRVEGCRVGAGLLPVSASRTENGDVVSLASGMRSRWLGPECWDFRTLALDATCGTGAPLDAESVAASGAIGGPCPEIRKIAKISMACDKWLGADRRPATGTTCWPAARTAGRLRRCDGARANPYTIRTRSKASVAHDLKERGSAAAHDAEFARSGGTARGHARGRRDVGRGRFLGDGGAAQGRGL